MLFGGLDLGQAQDPSALIVLEERPDAYACLGLKRWKGVGYPQVAREVLGIVSLPAFAGKSLFLGTDCTGVGRPVIDQMLEMDFPATCKIVPIIFTGGHQINCGKDGSLCCPKNDLVGAARVLLQTGRLLIPSNHPLAEVLQRELLNFRVKITAALNETYSAWREADNDDLVFAVAMAAFLALKLPRSAHDGPMVLTAPTAEEARDFDLIEVEKARARMAEIFGEREPAEPADDGGNWSNL